MIAFRLHYHALHTSLIGEIIDIGRAHRSRQHIADVGERHPQGIGLLAIHFELHLRRLGQCAFTHIHQDRTFLRGCQQFRARLH